MPSDEPRTKAGRALLASLASGEYRLTPEQEADYTDSILAIEAQAAAPDPVASPAPLDVESLAKLLHDADCQYSHSGSLGDVRQEFGLSRDVPWPPPEGKKAGWDAQDAGVREAITARLREVDTAADAEAWATHREVAAEYLAHAALEGQPVADSTEEGT